MKRIPYSRPSLPPLASFQRDLAKIWRSQRLSNYGPFATQFEDKARSWIHADCYATSSGDAALRILLKAVIGKRAHVDVLLPDWTFQSTINAVIAVGATPKISPVEAATLCLDIDDISNDLSIGDIVLATYAHGSTKCFTSLRHFADGTLLFDAAHALRPDVPIGDGAAFSLSGTKVVTCGEGGLIAMPTPQHRELIQRGRNYGFWRDYNAWTPGINGKMGEIPAALAIRSMQLFSSERASRRVIADFYREAISALGLGIAFQEFATDDVPKDFVVLFRATHDRVKAEAAMAARGIETKRYFRPLSLQPAYRDFASTATRERSAELWDRSLCLPFWAGLAAKGIDRIASAIRRALR